MQTLQNAKDALMGNPGFTQEDVADLQGKTVLVTGGTGGIGLEVARTFALSRARVLLLSSKNESGNDAIESIKKTNPAADIRFIACDLGNLREVKNVGDGIVKDEDRLDIFVADAGVGVNKFDVSSDGIDRHFAVNHLGHFLLLNRLLPLLRRTSRIETSAPPRIIAVSSTLHRQAPSSTRFASAEEITGDGARNMSALGLYGRSKLANLLFIKYGVAERVIRPNGDRMFALAVHPGAVATAQVEQYKEAYGTIPGNVMKQLVTPFMRSPDQGSLSTLWAATSADVSKEGYQGKYFENPGEFGKEGELVTEENGANLWNLSEKMVKDVLGSDALLPWDVKAKE
ncbi:NAD(P)-binding protein [Auriscalpium vulgare]|uniref:NAD(P)-binding protein n=1 Tax=Auriscalpium vulgare TaxID=40419 RepID=A0ACB8RJN9_9AGAM|nr:NAD(P)-binding protein [Auriscalpium vulgare]